MYMSLLQWLAYAYIIYASTFTLYFIMTTYIAFTRRHFYPFRVRAFTLLFISACGGLSFIPWIATLYAHDYVIPCLVTKLIVDVGNAALVLPYILRALQLSVLFNRMNASNEMMSETLLIPSTSFRTTSHTRCCRLTPHRMLALLICMLLPFLSYALITSYMSYTDIDAFMCDAHYHQERVARVVWSVIDGCELMVFVYALLMVSDVGCVAGRYDTASQHAFEPTDAMT